MNTASLAGEYYLQGVREMASGFLLKPGGDFQFFFTYGALDRYGSGKWALDDSGHIKGDRIIFNSAPRPAQDFALVESKQIAGDLTSIRITDNNPNLLRYVYGSLKKDAGHSWEPADKEGEIRFPKQEAEAISLLFEFCPERSSTFDIKNKTHNQFIFRFEPWIVEVFLENFTLLVHPNGLSGRHPLLKEGEYQYAKQ